MAENKEAFSIYTDEELMALINQGKVAAFDELYRRYSQRLMVYFVRMLNSNVALAEDALQDLFLKLVEKPALFDPTRSFKTWIFSVAHNTCKNFYRHQNVVKESSEYLKPDEPAHQENFYQLAARVDAALFKQLLFDVLNTLPPHKKE